MRLTKTDWKTPRFRPVRSRSIAPTGKRIPSPRRYWITASGKDFSAADIISIRNGWSSPLSVATGVWVRLSSPTDARVATSVADAAIPRSRRTSNYSRFWCASRSPAKIRIAFQSSPILSLPRSSFLDITVLAIGPHGDSRYSERLLPRIRFHAASASLTRFPPLTASVTSMSRLNFSHFPFMRSDTRD